jgi:hypothetical protein
MKRERCEKAQRLAHSPHRSEAVCGPLPMPNELSVEPQLAQGKWLRFVRKNA